MTLGGVQAKARLILACLRQHLKAGLHHDRRQHRVALSLPFQHEPISHWTAAALQWCSATATQENGLTVALRPLLDVENLNIPLPHRLGVADVEELFPSVQFELVQGLGARLFSKAVELLAVDMNDIAQIAAPAQDGSKDVVELRQIHLIGDRDMADHHRVNMAQNRS